MVAVSQKSSPFRRSTCLRHLLHADRNVSTVNLTLIPKHPKLVQVFAAPWRGDQANAAKALNGILPHGDQQLLELDCPDRHI